MNNSFVHRSAAALTHPVTVAALFTLLLNDHIFKTLWPGWFTGKLSDLAWVVFALPLLVFLLSFLTRSNPRIERSLFLVVYVGLPLLYAAYNTLEPLHDVILRPLLFLAGAGKGSLLDPSDSIVIPVGLAIALWVWKRSRFHGNELRSRLGLYAAAVAVLATIATSVLPPSDTAWHVATTADGWVIFEGRDFDLYGSLDGGMTWSRIAIEGGRSLENASSVGQSSVETPRGIYSITDSGIWRDTPAEAPTEVYSTGYLTEDSNAWAQASATRDLRRPFNMYEEERPIEREL